METGLKLRVSRLFRSSLYSCRHENAFDEVQEPVFLANRDVLPLLPLLKDPCSLTGSIGWGCRPRRWPIMQVGSTQSTTTRGVGSEADTIDSDESDSVDTFRKMLVKITSQNRAKSSGSDDGDRGRTGPSVSPESKSWDGVGGRKICECYHKEKLSGEKTTDGKSAQMADEEKNKKKSVLRRKKKRSNRQINLLSRSSSGTGWFSSEEEGNPIDAESEQLFSSKSTISSECSFQTTTRSQRRICTGRRLRSAERKKERSYPQYSLPKHSSSSSSPPSEPFESSGTDFPACTEKVRESVVVVKRSMDPYRDFKESMVEMIVEKKIFGQEDLQELLHCFLSLNSAHHHHVIIKVFADIWDALFCGN